MSDNAKLEVVRGQFGHTCVYLNDLRIAGEKPWGGGQTIHTFTIRVDDDRVRDAFLALWPEVADLRVRAERAEAKIAAIRTLASALGDGPALDIVALANKSRDMMNTLDRIVLLCDGEADS